MAHKITKALIPVAGLGTRFLPATATVPKEMLPIVDQPTLLYNIREAVNSGIEDIILVTGRNKNAIVDFFDTQYELEDQLEKSKKFDLLEILHEIKSLANIISIRQKHALGLGHAVYQGHRIIGEQPFALLLGDELMVPNSPNERPATGQLIDLYNKTNTSTVAVMEVPKADVSKYGVIAYETTDLGQRVLDVIEKPPVASAPSQLALPGRYVFSEKIFSYLKNLKPGKNNEIQLTDAMVQLAKNDGLYATTVSSRRYDAGDKFGYLKANIEMGLNHPQTGKQLKAYLEDLSQKGFKI